MKNVAIILSAGVGHRLGLNKPKQFMKIAGKKIIEHTVDCFEHHSDIHEIALVVGESYYHEYEEMILKNKWIKVKKILIGGSERYFSSLSAIKAYEKEQDVNLIFHDGVRPLVSKRIITEVCDKIQYCDAIDVTVPPVDTIVELDLNKRIITNIPNRKNLRRGQTPQAFRLNIIKKAYELALKDPDFTASDDCGIVKKYLPNVDIYSIDGEESNIKLTNPADIYLLDKLFQIKSTTISHKFDAFQGKVVVIFGGNSGIGADIVRLARENGAIVYVFSRSNNVDISNILQVEDALKQVFRKENKINYVINSAAILNKSPLLQLSNEEIKRLIEVNFLGAINTSVAAHKYLKRNGGMILQFTSSSYTRGRAFYSLYSSSKAAVVNFIQAIAEEWAVDGVNINCINPQRTKTPMRIKNFGLEDEKTLLKSKDVAITALSILSENVTGEVIDIKLDLV